MHISTFGNDITDGMASAFTSGSSDQPYEVDVGRPDMPVIDTGGHVVGIEPAAIYFSPASKSVDSPHASDYPSGSSGSSSGSSDSGVLATLGKLFGGGTPPPNAGVPVASSGIPTWALVAVPLVLGGMLLVAVGSSGGRRRPAYAGYKRRRRSRRSRR